MYGTRFLQCEFPPHFKNMKFKIVKVEEKNSKTNRIETYFYIKQKSFLFWYDYKVFYVGWRLKTFSTELEADHHIKHFLAPKIYTEVVVKEFTYKIN